MRNNKGFSLIELSIVLIILGLLVAGVTGGASLIKSAQIRSIVTELNNYRNGYNAYYAQEGELLKVAASDKPWEELANKKIIDSTSDTAFLASKYKNAFWSFDTSNAVFAKATALALTGKNSSDAAAGLFTADDAKKILTKTLGNPAAAGSNVSATGCAISELTGENAGAAVNISGTSVTGTYMLLYRINLD